VAIVEGVLWFGGAKVPQDHKTTEPQNHKTNKGAAAGAKKVFKPRL
jgi:hypothetical protein